ncbi:hypothetical protein BKA65DRAFT_490119 [Rhexocercosporidium sp. MPI-PUGE-AT-0058]|nr:hypothetical protein BKA65DRAFT_490119 [Rhexocercosporidium sp. MPI-PUGE-AT-0058]
MDSDDDDLEVLDDDHILAIGNDNGFGPESNRGTSGCDGDAHEGDGVISEVGEDIRYFDAIYYEDVRLLVVRGPDSGGRNVLAMEVTIAHHKGARGSQSPRYSSSLELTTRSPVPSHTSHVFEHKV